MRCLHTKYLKRIVWRVSTLMEFESMVQISTILLTMPIHTLPVVAISKIEKLALFLVHLFVCCCSHVLSPHVHSLNLFAVCSKQSFLLFFFLWSFFSNQFKRQNKKWLEKLERKLWTRTPNMYLRESTEKRKTTEKELHFRDFMPRRRNMRWSLRPIGMQYAS